MLIVNCFVVVFFVFELLSFLMVHFHIQLGMYFAHFAGRGIGTMVENWHTSYNHVCFSFRFVEADFSYIQDCVYMLSRLDVSIGFAQNDDQEKT